MTDLVITRAERAILMYLVAPDRLLDKVRKEYADVLPAALLRSDNQHSVKEGERG